ncbi:MAG: hypothetical protein GY906_30175 [bacterium]|nr:hypothetical protein [bacterium]
MPPKQSPVPDIYLNGPIPSTASGNRVFVPISQWREFRIRLAVSEACKVYARYASSKEQVYEEMPPFFDGSNISADSEYVFTSDNHKGEYYLLFGFDNVAAEMTGYVTITADPA